MDTIKKISYVVAGAVTMLTFIFGVTLIDRNTMLSIIIIIFSVIGAVAVFTYIWSLIILTIIIHIGGMIKLCFNKCCSKKIHNSSYLEIV